MSDHAPADPLSAADKYITSYFDNLRVAGSVPDSTLQHIRSSFYGSIATDNYADWNRLLINAAREFLRDSAIFSRLNHRLFDKEARALCLLDKRELFYLRGMEDSAYAPVYPLLYRKNYSELVIRYTYELADPDLCGRLLHRNKEIADSLVESILIRDGIVPPTSQFGLALKYRQRLKIRPSLADSLLGQAMYLIRMHDSALRADPFASLDLGPYEARLLNRFLTKDQYTALLDIRNRPGAAAEAEKDWLRLEKFNLTKDIDKQMAIQDITDFYVERWSAWNRLDDDKDKQMMETRRLEENKPEILMRLDQAMWNAKQKEESNNLKLHW